MRKPEHKPYNIHENAVIKMGCCTVDMNGKPGTTA